MGLTIARLFQQLWFEGRDTRILMVGLDAAGKTTVCDSPACCSRVQLVNHSSM